MAERAWIAKLKELSGKAQPYVTEIAMFACKNLGIPGGKALADVIGSIDKIRGKKKLDKLNEVLGVVLTKGETIQRMLEERGVDPARTQEALATLAAQNDSVRLAIDDVTRSLRDLPGAIEFLTHGVGEILDEVRRVGDRIDGLAAEMREGQADVLVAIGEIRASLEQLRKDADPRLVAGVVNRIRALPDSQRRGLPLLGEVSCLLANVGQTGAADEVNLLCRSPASGPTVELARLTVIAGPMKGRVFAFAEPDRFLFGRAPDARCSLPDDPYVSRHHFLVDVSPPGFSLHDLGSKNGTIVGRVRYGGRKPLEPGVRQAAGGALCVQLKDGDEIEVGDSRLRMSARAPCGETMTSPPARRPGDPVEFARGVLAPLGYEVLGLLGTGGAGVVVRANDPGGQRVVAVKVMRPECALDPMLGALFAREIDISRQLHHPNVIEVLDSGTSQGALFVVMECVEGSDLEALCRAQRRGAPLERAAPLMLQILAGLSHIHGTSVETTVIDQATGLSSRKRFQGVVHRDLKPSNILLGRGADGHVRSWITDLGLAKVYGAAGMTDLTKPGVLGGSPFYWPREQITEYRRLTPSSDVYSVGAIFFRILTGRLPRPGLDALGANPGFHEVCRVIVSEKARPLREVEPSVPEAVARVVDRSLAEDPSARYPDAGTMARDLGAALEESAPGSGSRRRTETP